MSDVTRYVSMMQKTLSARGYSLHRKTLRKIAGRAIKKSNNEQERVVMMVNELKDICRA